MAKKQKEVITGIYKITNKKNGKAYVGQAIDIYKRWRKHKTSPFNKNSNSYNLTIACALRKHGIENFIFEIIEKCPIEELDEREIYWIEYYDTYHNGYNETLGGKSGRKALNERALGIMNDLKNTSLNNSEIANKWEVSTRLVSAINTGYYWFQENVKYPIRPHLFKQKEKHYCQICGAEITWGSILCLDCYNKRQAKNIPQKEELLYLILRYPFVQIGKMYDVSDNAVRKWCKKYALPYKQNEIQKLRIECKIEEWHTNINNDVAKRGVVQYDLNDNPIATYASIREASKAIECESCKKYKFENVEGGISSCCKNKTRTAYGYIWKYADQIN